MKTYSKVVAIKCATLCKKQVKRETGERGEETWESKSAVGRRGFMYVAEEYMFPRSASDWAPETDYPPLTIVNRHMGPLVGFRYAV